MSPTILRLLLNVRRYNQPNVRVLDEGYDMFGIERHNDYWAAGLDASRLVDALTLFVRSGPYRRYCEESEREYEAQMAAGGREICPDCGERSVVSDTVLTYGVRSNPNSEYSVYRRCERDTCDYSAL